VLCLVAKGYGNLLDMGVPLLKQHFSYHDVSNKLVVSSARYDYEVREDEHKIARVFAPDRLNRFESPILSLSGCQRLGNNAQLHS